MKSYEMVETLSEKANVSLEQAKDALEKSNWDMLDAAIYLERTKSSVNKDPYAPPSGYQYVSSFMNTVGGQFRQTPFPPNQPFPQNGGFNPPPQGNFPPNRGRQPGFYPPPPHGNPGFNGAPPHMNNYPNFRTNSVDEFLNKAGNKAEKIIGDGTSNFFVVRRNGMKIIQLPILLFIIMLLATLPVFPIVVITFIIGLAFDCKYSFEGKSLEDITINKSENNNPDPSQVSKNDIKSGIDLNKKSDDAQKQSGTESTTDTPDESNS